MSGYAPGQTTVDVSSSVYVNATADLNTSPLNASLSAINVRQGAINTVLTQINATANDLNVRLNAVNVGVGAVNAGVSAVNAGVYAVNVCAADINTTLHTINTTLQQINTKFAPWYTSVRLWSADINQQNTATNMTAGGAAGVAVPAGTIDPVHLAVKKADAVTLKVYGYSSLLGAGAKWVLVDTISFTEKTGLTDCDEACALRGCAGFERLQAAINAVTIPTGSQNYVNSYFGFIY